MSRPSGIENRSVSPKMASVVQKPPQRIGSKLLKSDMELRAGRYLPNHLAEISSNLPSAFMAARVEFTASRRAWSFLRKPTA